MFSFFIAPSSRQPLVLSHVTRHSILEYWFASRDFPMPTQRRQTWKDFPSGHRARNDTGRCLAAANHDLRAQCPVDFDTRFYSFFTFYFVSPIFSSDRNIIMRTATVEQPGPAMEKKALNARQLSSELESFFFISVAIRRSVDALVFWCQLLWKQIMRPPLRYFGSACTSWQLKLRTGERQSCGSAQHWAGKILFLKIVRRQFVWNRWNQC